MAVSVKYTLGKIIDPGEMDRVIEIYSITKVERSTGYTHIGYTLSHTVRAKLMAPKSLDETIEANRLSETLKQEFIIRYISGLDAKSRIVYDGQNYDIIGITELGRRKFSMITTIKVEVDE